jgi:hypothetical protein
MKYAIIREDGITELREDPIGTDGAIILTDEQYNQLASSSHIISDGKIIINPNPPIDKTLGIN